MHTSLVQINKFSCYIRRIRSAAFTTYITTFYSRNGEKKMKQLIHSKVANFTAGLLLISATILCWSWLEHGHGQPTASCESGTCTIELPMKDREWRLSQVCSAQGQADDLLIYCVFDTEGDEKVGCYSDLKKMDQMVLTLNKGFKLDFGEYPTCKESFRTKWEERKQ